MKKLSQYILILFIIASGILSPVSVIYAAGSCYSHLDAYNTEGQADTSNPPLTQEQCGFNAPKKYWSTDGGRTAICTPPKVANGSACVNPPPLEFPLCTSPTLQQIKDGWGWENNKSCKVAPAVSAPIIYIPLSPLPCKETVDGPGCIQNPVTKKWELTSWTPPPATAKGNVALGLYLNMMIRLFIGICAVLAVIMIVIGGIEYMTTELVSSKEAGKERIRNAIFGLLLALGAWTLLYTINPDILKSDPDSLTAVTVLVEAPIVSDNGTPPGTTKGCGAGVVKTTINMFACNDVVANINNMLAASKAAGVNITGGGYRSNAQQTQLRKANCKGNTTDRSAPCNPLTALPGESNHNNGKAFDLRCDGAQISTNDNKCFVWLKTNASKYGLQNLVGGSEPWHWSVDGH